METPVIRLVWNRTIGFDGRSPRDVTVCDQLAVDLGSLEVHVLVIDQIEVLDVLEVNHRPLTCWCFVIPV